LLFIKLLPVSGGKHNVTVWRPSVCAAQAQRDSPGGSTRCGQRTFRPDNKEDCHVTLVVVFLKRNI